MSVTEKSAHALVFQCLIIYILLAEVHLLHVTVGYQEITGFSLQNGPVGIAVAAVAVTLDPCHMNAEARLKLSGISCIIAAMNDYVHRRFFRQLLINIYDTGAISVGVANR